MLLCKSELICKTEVELDLSTNAGKFDLINAIGVNTSEFAKTR